MKHRQGVRSRAPVAKMTLAPEEPKALGLQS